ncbi:MAG: type IV pilus assembly protein PilC [Verrucomicrobiales bacterium]|jgi:type IV pilus assembly protein PilC
MASMLKARITTSDALQYYVQDHPDAALSRNLMIARSSIESGTPLHFAFRKSGLFDDNFVSLVKAGSDSGQLHKAFASIASRFKKEAQFKAKIRKATILPAGIIFVLILLFIVAQLKIVPEVEGLLSGVDQDPDKFSDIMFGISHVTQVIWPFVIGGLIASVVIVWKVASVRNTILYLLMSKWRMLRQLVMGMRQMQFLGSLHLMHSNGLTLAQSISTAAAAIRGTPLYGELIDAGKKYQTLGIPFSDALKNFTSCDHQVSHMISIGERASALDNQLEMLVAMYEEDSDRMMETLTQVLNIAVLLLASVLIACVFIGAFLPIFLMGPKMMNGSGI